MVAHVQVQRGPIDRGELGERVRLDRPPPGEPRSIGYLLIAPAVIVYSLFVLVPLVHSFVLSLYSWDGVGPKTFVGLGNFEAIVRTPNLVWSFVHSAVLMFFYAGLTTVVGLLLAAVLGRGSPRGMTVYRTLLFIPYVVAPTAVAVIWRWLLAPDGPLNGALSAIGLGGLARPWLGDFQLALPSVGLVGTWVLFGLAMVLFVAGVQKIPTSLYDAVRIDGGGAVREFFVVTLPGLRNEIVVVLVLTITTALRSFDLIYVLTNGGPGSATQVPSVLVYTQAFVVGSVGGAAAVGLVLTVLILVASAGITRIGSAGWQ